MKKDHNYFLDISVKTQVKKVLFEFVYTHTGLIWFLCFDLLPLQYTDLTH